MRLAVCLQMLIGVEGLRATCVSTLIWLRSRRGMLGADMGSQLIVFREGLRAVCMITLRGLS